MSTDIKYDKNGYRASSPTVFSLQEAVLCGRPER